jgi:anthranilate phosphoribosyltransferase
VDAHLHTIANGDPLDRSEAEAVMTQIMDGSARDEHIAALLMGLRTRGETLDELVGFTKTMREFAVSVDPGDSHAIDLCGTGGDGASTFNISTTASLIAAGAGVTVAKHGNRSVSSKSGSADVLETLGVQIDLEKKGVERCLHDAGIAFLFAPFFHPAMRHVMPVRKSLGVRTFFNILGPLCNPAGVTRQIVGAFDTQTAQTMARILAQLDADHIVTLHSDDGMDEVSVSAATTLFEGRQCRPWRAARPRKTPPSSTTFSRARTRVPGATLPCSTPPTRST